LLVTLLSPRLAAAAPEGSAAQPRPVIVPGREAEIMALFEPHTLGDELEPGWNLHSFEIDAGTISVWLVGSDTGPDTGPEPSYAHLTLDHLDHAPPDARALTGFSLKIVEQPPGSEAAVATIIAAIEANDDGSFWGTAVVFANEPREHPFSFDEFRSRFGSWAVLWLHDGLVFVVFVMAVLLGLAVHQLRQAPAWIRWSLPGLVVLGAALRLGLSPEVAMAPWPYTRVLITAGRIFYGPGLALVHPGPLWLSETITASTLAFSLLAPLAVYVHARYLLDDHRGAFVAALVVTILPLHLRFSHSDAAFIPSITISSMTFALVHAAMREKSQVGGWLAVALIGFPIALMYQVRPLNILYFPMLLAAPFLNQGLHADKRKAELPRIIAAFVIITIVTFGLGVPQLLEGFGAPIHEGLSLRTLSSALGVIFNPRLNELVNPIFSPPGLTALAVLGAVTLWRRGRRRLFAFLVGWLFLFLIAHAYVVPGSMYMQARYHLHLVVPYMLLVACGADAALRWLADNRERKSWLRGDRYRLVLAAALVYVLASPLIHLHGIRHVALNDMREWVFVHEQREQIASECTIIEYTGKGSGAGVRFARVGAWVEDGVPRDRYTTVEIRTAGEGEPEIPDQVRALLEDPPDCLYWYEGLPCFGEKPVEQAKAPECRAIEGFAALEQVAVTRFASAPYDENLAYGLGGIEQLELRLFRVYRKAD
jgi:hypothetical protein